MNEKNVRWDKIFYGKDWVNQIVDTIKTKDILQGVYFKRYILRAIMAGFIISIITVFVLAIKMSLISDIPLGVVNIIAAIAFSFALVMILFTNSELLTSNFMYFTVGLYYRLIKPTRVAKIFLLCFVGNVVGAILLFTLMLGTDVVTPDMKAELVHIIDHKSVDSSFMSILIKAIFANFFINISLVIAMQIHDIFAKMFVMMFGVAIFAFMGYEHVVYDSCLFIAGLLFDPLALSPLHLVKNIIAAGIGNYIGGGLIIGLFYAYLNDHHQFDKERLN
ncbi:formate/nitrite transporter family protein [Staphylococcus massiliensis]|uniref:Formate nitrite transporter n=1 Tax=Staphylococcus massiliensis S46 TaxID=1229783 RepID=K9ANW4_9STAP|nr:formate/nitrite transporter family protein [Staphylococcus massiliensis]EKU48994.1 formate nitrite transporter [Staphylococcus massiliensis S46]MCG3399435.1 formate/nitrite transporter family protein [Staphylococcus massiliensis]MCG3402465.1 formate/nitrite transporter family protein [Staphylococcus massiliensis]MCG3411571.1 formate/nitrite transporter family protein [Staphylococcus massiliensis]PNZ99469.1 formate/nitrite transporter [Staphylococcus massiliensis CCUG 55927]